MFMFVPQNRWMVEVLVNVSTFPLGSFFLAHGSVTSGRGVVFRPESQSSTERFARSKSKGESEESAIGSEHTHSQHSSNKVPDLV